MHLLISPAATVRCLDDEAIDLTCLGKLDISRASQVEPDVQGHWWADLSPVNGPRLGPLPHRSQALQEEVSWLHEHRLRPTD